MTIEIKESWFVDALENLEKISTDGNELAISEIKSCLIKSTALLYQIETLKFQNGYLINHCQELQGTNERLNRKIVAFFEKPLLEN